MKKWKRELQLAGGQPPRPDHKGLKWLIVVGLASVQCWAPLLQHGPAKSPPYCWEPLGSSAMRKKAPLIRLDVRSFSFLVFIITNWSCTYTLFAN